MIDRLICPVRNYAWGDLVAIPELVGADPTGEPQAELWMGANAGAPSLLESTGQGLDEVVREAPVEMLGELQAAKDSDLPFLGKVLAAAQPLSIQVHPTKQQAEVGFAKEQAAGVRIDDRQRTYKDRNHKPEMVVALQPFSALCGFRDPQRTLGLLQHRKLDGLAPLRDQLGSAKLSSVVDWLLTAPTEQISTMVGPFLNLQERALPAEFAWLPDVAARYPNDAGVLVGLLLNYVTLQPGEGMFLGAGSVHGYLSGLVIEVMANSDNVVRCGLTEKNIDVAELLSIASFDAGDPPIQRPTGPVSDYRTTSDEFLLQRIDLDLEGPCSTTLDLGVVGPEILLVTEGAVEIKTRNGSLLGLSRGQVGFVSASELAYELRGSGRVWRMTVGSPSEPR